uniref:Uncharacterized protein n=1 Tax=Physcomitrium patens TaxID=3218 RepID=A0A2K1IKA2_PHYPA|nr:hypothetical protein PHYPA_028392 [Physcomitrium patens]
MCVERMNYPKIAATAAFKIWLDNVLQSKEDKSDSENDELVQMWRMHNTIPWLFGRFLLWPFIQRVTIGATGKDAENRHPKIQEGVLDVWATILGNIVFGQGAMVAAGSLVLKDVPAHRCCSIFG